jgi:hypothetical protein
VSVSAKLAMCNVLGASTMQSLTALIEATATQATGEPLAGNLEALERLQAALAGPSGPISAYGDEEAELRASAAVAVALWLSICPQQRRRLDVPERRAQTSAAGRAARAHGAAVGAKGFEAAVRSAAGFSSAGWPGSSPGHCSVCRWEGRAAWLLA